MKKPVTPGFDEEDAHILPRKFHVPTTELPKVDELAWGGVLSTETDMSSTIVLCWTCRKPIYINYPIEVLSKFASKQRPPTPVGPWKVPKDCGDPCPICGGLFARYDERLQKAQYLTDKGLI